MRGGAGNGNGHKASSAATKAFHATGSRLYGQDWDAKRHELVRAYTKGRTESSGDLTVDELRWLTEQMEKKLAAQLEAANVQDAPEVELEIPA